ncbi:flagellar filament capping protein FliD [Desulfospira joergensenii]|uniref:flagellar filament capping protein FliD n=1 Tax=Desulfospira joergensenii TaxID=53329 RepID=UPI0003B35569|nr:flagellar filament capping protein FliD [Desulfospira joergensenii]
MAGSITTLGIGSGLDLQNILDQLKEVEKAPITAKETEKSELQKKTNAYSSVNSKLFSMKSKTLSLSLESDFLNNKTSVSDEDILTATANNGIKSSSHSIEVIQKAQYSSWQTKAGAASRDSAFFPGLITGIESKDEAFITEDGTMIMKYGAPDEEKEIGIHLEPGMSLTDIVGAVNASSANKDEDGNPLIMASLGIREDGEKDHYYIRLASASGGDSLDSQISVTGADFAIADTTVAMGLAGSDSLMFLSVAPGTTYEQFATAVNNAEDNPGITASVVDTGDSEAPFRLTLTAKETGEDNRIGLSENLTNAMTQTTGVDESLNAVFKVNGVEYQRQKNDGIDDVISGVTLSLKKAGETSLGIQKDLDSVKENIIALVDGFNDLISEIKGSDEDDEDTESDESESILADSYEMKTILSRLQALITTNVTTDSPYSSLIDLGLELNKDGTMNLDETVLEQAIQSDPEGIQALFIGDVDAGIAGLGDIIDDGITAMVSSTGLVSTEIDEAETRMDNLERDIEAATERLDKRYETLTAEFVRLDSLISSLNSQADAMNSIIESFTSAADK